MSAARRDFLSKKYYAPLLNTLCSRILPLVGEHPVILDAGCGEGYYTAGIRAALTAAGKTPAIAGIDISKSILRLAAKREKQVEFAVASCYHLPFADETADLLLDCFSPLAIDEFRRVRRLSQGQIGVISAPICAFYRRSFGEFSIVSVQTYPLQSCSGSKVGQDLFAGGFQCGNVDCSIGVNNSVCCEHLHRNSVVHQTCWCNLLA